MPDKKPQPGTISADGAAKLIMVQPQWVRKLAAQGYIEKAGPGRYLTVSVVQGYIRWLKEERKSDSRLAAENRVREARARDLEVRTEARCKELIEVDESEEILDELIGMARDVTVGSLADITSDPALARRIDGWIEDLLRRLNETKERGIASLRKHGKAFVDVEAD